ncbi:hypothetical protein ABEV38_19315 [Parageobacillus thermoglucosidasius]|uniref:hypothetical protein n=1 Tax=Parageobacillus thermoglucosidasius TaxID=1426 RepID=UPI003D2B3A9D
MEKKPRRRGQKPEDFKVRIVYSDYNDEETFAQEMKKMEEWIYKVLFTKEYRKSAEEN